MFCETLVNTLWQLADIPVVGGFFEFLLGIVSNFCPVAMVV